MTTGIDALASFAPQIVNPRHGLSRVVQCLGVVKIKDTPTFAPSQKHPTSVQGVCRRFALSALSALMVRSDRQPIPVQ